MPHQLGKEEGNGNNLRLSPLFLLRCHNFRYVHLVFVSNKLGNKMREAWPFLEVTNVTSGKEGDTDVISLTTADSSVCSFFNVSYINRW